MALTPPSSSTASPSNALAIDIRSLNALKYDAGTTNSAQTTREAAKQFESLFMRELIKSMRDATMKSGLMEGGQADLGQDMMDQQLSVTMSGRQGGAFGGDFCASCRCRWVVGATPLFRKLPGAVTRVRVVL